MPLSPSIGSRGRTAFRVDALFTMTSGLVFMGNPLFGPSLVVSGYLVMLAGFLLLVVAVFLGGAGLEKGLLANRLALVRSANFLSAILLTLWALAGNLSVGARVFLGLLATCLVGVGALQERAIRHPNPAFVRTPSTQAQRQAALRGEHNPGDR